MLPDPATYKPTQYVPCHICRTGALTLKSQYRMSAPLVLIGYIFLIPSAVGFFIAAIMLFSSIGQSSAGTVVLGGTFAVIIAVISLIGGLFGWLLIMKKKVLKCGLCRATVSAS